jgi:hypothetical protein
MAQTLKIENGGTGFVVQEVGKIKGLEMTHMIVDELSTIGAVGADWSKLTTIAPAMGVIGRSSIEPSGVNVAGVSYKTQKFEDRKTVFGAQLRVQVRVPEYVLKDAREPESFVRTLIADNAEKLKAEVAAQCPDCAACPHNELRMDEHDDFARAERIYLLTARCRSDGLANAMSRVCPDGKTAVLKGYTVLVPDLKDAPYPTHIDIPGTSVSTPEPEPYIRKDPDRPTSDSGAAW